MFGTLTDGNFFAGSAIIVSNTCSAVSTQIAVTKISTCRQTIPIQYTTIYYTTLNLKAHRTVLSYSLHLFYLYLYLQTQRNLKINDKFSNMYPVGYFSKNGEDQGRMLSNAQKRERQSWSVGTCESFFSFESNLESNRPYHASRNKAWRTAGVGYRTGL